MSTILTTTDSAYTYTAITNNGGAVIKDWQIKNNNKVSNTQGFLVKVEKGEKRVELVLSLADTKTNLETNVLPMLGYPTNINVTLDRNIPSKTVKTGLFAMVDYEMVNEFSEGLEQEIEIKIIEVLS